MADSILVASGVEFSFEENHVLRGVDLNLERGTITVLMGINGCGKSTFIDCVLGINRLKAGEILVEGQSVSQLRANKIARLVSYVPQVHDRSFPYLVEQIVLMGRTVYERHFDSNDADDEELVHEALVTCGIEHLAHRPYTALSGGEMQMTLLARSLVQNASLILMDEPTAHLDFRNELVFLEALERLVLEEGVTILMATHSPNQAFHLSSVGVDTRVALMNEGVIEAYGNPSMVLTRENLRDIFRIDGHVISDEYDGGGSPKTIQQIVALATLPGRGEQGEPNAPSI